MLETYFVKPQTVDRIRACWIGAEIERYAGWLSEQGYSTRTVLRRVPMLVAFGEFARLRGALVLADLPAHVDGFVAMRVASYRRGLNAATEVRGAVEQMRPTLVVSNVGSDAITLSGLLESFAKQGGATVNGNQLTNGIITDGYLPTLGSTSNSWIALFSKIHQQYDPKAPFDGNVLYGEAVAYTFVQSMLKAGRNPTRANLVSAIEAGLPQGPAVAPYAYSATDHSGITGAYMGVIKNGALVQEGPVLTTDTSASGPITTYTGTEQQAPASGIPSP